MCLDGRTSWTVASLSTPAPRRKGTRSNGESLFHAPHALPWPACHTENLVCSRNEPVPCFRPKIHMVSRASMSVRPRPNHSLKDLDTGFSSSWPQANLRYPFHAWRKASITAFWRSFGGTRREERRGSGGQFSFWGRLGLQAETSCEH